MEKFHEQMLGALIGLARATDGNEHLITPGTTELIRDCLSAVRNGTGDTEELMARITEEKRSMVPDCFLCASPCGRTDAFDLGLLRQEAEEIRVRKQKLLNLVLEMGNSLEEPLLYNALTVIGIAGYPVELLDQVIDQLQ